MAKNEKKMADPDKFEAPQDGQGQAGQLLPEVEGTPDAIEGDAAKTADPAAGVGSVEAQLADLAATVALQAKEIGVLKGPKGIPSATQPFKLEEQPPTQRELAEKELRKYVKRGGWTRDLHTNKQIKVEPGFRKGVTADKIERAKKLIDFLNKGEGAKKRDPRKPGWDLTILDENHKRTLV